MSYDPERHHRRSIRLKGYDYSQAGAYFVTICVQGRECLFGEIVGDAMRLSDAGQMVRDVWLGLPDRFPGVELDEFAVMPNHSHGIIVIVGAGLVPAPDVPRVVQPTAEASRRATTRVAPTLGEIVGAFKSITTHEYVMGVRQHGWPPFPGRLWQRDYYEHIIRSEPELDRIRAYIANNPLRWALDMENPLARMPAKPGAPWQR
jgi:putative transposase